MGYFFVPGPLEGLNLSGDVLGRTNFISSLLKNISRGSKNRLFPKGVSPGFWIKNDQSLKSTFFTPLCLKGSRRIVKLP